MSKAWMIAFAVVCFVPQFMGAAEVTGRVRVAGRKSGATLTIVYAESLGGPSVVKPGHFSMKQRNKSFVPHVLAVPVGSTVDFTNDDLIFHNVFSLSSPAPFDLGLYRAGASKSRVFSGPAVYRVFCNIHPQMTGVLLVLPTSWIAEADLSGAYRMNLPPGRYRLTAWSERSQPASVETALESGTGTFPELTLDESKFVELPHKNKYGQDYPRTAYDPLKQ